MHAVVYEFKRPFLSSKILYPSSRSVLVYHLQKISSLSFHTHLTRKPLHRCSGNSLLSHLSKFNDTTSFGQRVQQTDWWEKRLTSLFSLVHPNHFICSPGSERFFSSYFTHKTLAHLSRSLISIIMYFASHMSQVMIVCFLLTCTLYPLLSAYVCFVSMIGKEEENDALVASQREKDFGRTAVPVAGSPPHLLFFACWCSTCLQATGIRQWAKKKKKQKKLSERNETIGKRGQWVRALAEFVCVCGVYVWLNGGSNVELWAFSLFMTCPNEVQESEVACVCILWGYFLMPFQQDASDDDGTERRDEGKR